MAQKIFSKIKILRGVVLSLTSLILVVIFISLPAQSEDFLDIDSDGDGYLDAVEIAAGYSPFNPQPILIVDSDVDGDGLSDFFELAFKTNPYEPDSDSDGFNDYLEIDNGYSPISIQPEKLARKIEIVLSTQRLDYYINNIKWRSFIVSTGKPSMPTPTGEFTVVNKSVKAWSKSYGLWMPFWLGLDRGRIGIHELPVWPSGYREGEDHLGKAVSHGCIRLGVGPAEYLFNRIDVGAKVFIKK